MFHGAAHLFLYHREFLPKLEKCGKDFDRIVDLLLTEGGKLAQIYVGYSWGKTQSEALLVEHQEFFDGLQKQRKASESLSSYLIRPIQRLAKYPLMLKVCVPWYMQCILWVLVNWLSQCMYVCMYVALACYTTDIICTYICTYI